MSVLATIRLDSLKDLALLPDGIELLNVKQEGVGGGTRWPADAMISVAFPEVPYTGVYQEEIDWFLEEHGGQSMTYGEVASDIQAKFPESRKISQVRATLKNCKLLERV